MTVNDVTPEATPEVDLAMAPPVLQVDGLDVSFGPRSNPTRVVEGVHLRIERGEVLGLVGESGSGKTMTALAALGLAQVKGATVTVDHHTLCGQDLRGLSDRGWSRIRGREVGMIFQQPTRSLNPAFTVGEQIAEGIRTHLGLSRKEAWDRAVSMLDRVQISDAAKRAHDYPHMFSGGMCQRVMIAMALACGPKLLIADEPTTALDVTVQAKVLDLLRELQHDLGVAILFITHDLGVVSEMCSRVAVMYAGQIVEVSTAADLFARPDHPYTRGLIASVPRVGASTRLVSIPGTVPAPTDVPPGCRFHPRCPHAVPGPCTAGPVELEDHGEGRSVRCARLDEIRLDRAGGPR